MIQNKTASFPFKWPDKNGNSAKGQIISECPYEIIVCPKIATKNFRDFCPKGRCNYGWPDSHPIFYVSFKSPAELCSAAERTKQNKTKDDECQEYRLVCRQLKSHWINLWVPSNVKNELQL